MKKYIRKAVFHFLNRHYNLLLIFLILLFIFRPYNDSLMYLGWWKVLLTSTVLAAIYNCKHQPRARLAEIIVAVPTIIFCWLDIFQPHPTMFIINASLSILFTILCTATIIYDVIVRTNVNTETLKGVICAYFLVAIAFAYTFWLIEFLQPGSFSIATNHDHLYYYTQYLSEMIYFSFVTLLTIGYGDVVAIKNISQTAVILEGIIGQFYVAILVARLVAIYSFRTQAKIMQQYDTTQKKS